MEIYTRICNTKLGGCGCQFQADIARRVLCDDCRDRRRKERTRIASKKQRAKNSVLPPMTIIDGVSYKPCQFCGTLIKTNSVQRRTCDACAKANRQKVKQRHQADMKSYRQSYKNLSQQPRKFDTDPKDMKVADFISFTKTQCEQEIGQVSQFIPLSEMLFHHKQVAWLYESP